MSGFHYHGQPVTAQEAADIITKRRAEYRVQKLERFREYDERRSGILRQLWSMIRGRA